MRDKGQSLVEFIIIVAVIAIGGIMVLTLLGGNINEMFSSSVAKTADFKPFGTETVGSPADDKNVSDPGTATIPITTTISSLSIDGVDIKLKGNGSASLTFDSQKVEIPSAAMDNLSDMFMATGTSGGGLTTEVVQAISSLIAAHKDEYPDSDVPIKMVFGDGVRDQSDYNNDGGHYEGDATSNSVTLSVGDHLILIQKDQTFGGEVIDNGDIHVIDGTIKDLYGNGDRQFEGKITSTKPGLSEQIYRSDVVPDGNTIINGSIPGDIAANAGGITGTWSFTLNGNNYDL